MLLRYYSKVYVYLNKKYEINNKVKFDIINSYLYMSISFSTSGLLNNTNQNNEL